MFWAAALFHWAIWVLISVRWAPVPHANKPAMETEEPFTCRIEVLDTFIVKCPKCSNLESIEMVVRRFRTFGAAKYWPIELSTHLFWRLEKSASGTERVEVFLIQESTESFCWKKSDSVSKHVSRLISEYVTVTPVARSENWSFGSFSWRRLFMNVKLRTKPDREFVWRRFFLRSISSDWDAFSAKWVKDVVFREWMYVFVFSLL